MGAFLVVVLIAVGLGMIGAGRASAVAHYRFHIGGCGMPATPVDMWAGYGNYKTVIALDGLRATSRTSGWAHQTNIAKMAYSGVNVVQPVGGLASFYTDWDAKSGNKVKYRYRWTCRLTKIIEELDARGMAVGRSGKYAIMGISMGGGAALTYGAYHRKRISHAFSMSGYISLASPGMRTAIRLAMIDAGIEAGVGPFNSDAMWGPPWSIRWINNDPVMQLNRMRGMKVRIASATGIWGRYNTDPIGSVKGTPLEILALQQAGIFQAAAAAQSVPITTDYALLGTHQWGYWQDMVWRAKNSGWFRDR